MDTETVVKSVQKTGRCVVVEEGLAAIGVGAEVAARIMEKAFDYLDAPVARVSGQGRADAVRGEPGKARAALGRRSDRGREGRSVTGKEFSMSYNALNPPPLVRDKPANEVMRVAVHNGELHMSLRRGFNDPGAWGAVVRRCGAPRRARLRAREDRHRRGSARAHPHRLREGDSRAAGRFGRDDRDQGHAVTEKDAPLFDALHVPPEAFEKGGVEVLRAVIVDGGLHVSLRRAFDDRKPGAC
jgi:hypothetical protein